MVQVSWLRLMEPVRLMVLLQELGRLKVMTLPQVPVRE